MNTRSLCVRHAASKDEARQVICGVYHEEGHTVATDGRMLAVFEDDSDDTSEGIMPNAAVQRGVSMMRKANGAATTHCSGDHVFFGDGEAELSMPLIEGTYPAWRNVMPKEQPEATIRISCALLEKCLKIVKEAGVDGDGALSFHINGDKFAMTLRCSQVPELRMVLMPMRPE